MAGTLPEARAPPDKAWQPRWTLCCGATKVCWLGAQKLRSTAAQHTATTSTGRVRLWEAIASKCSLVFSAVRQESLVAVVAAAAAYKRVDAKDDSAQNT